MKLNSSIYSKSFVMNFNPCKFNQFKPFSKYLSIFLDINQSINQSIYLSIHSYRLMNKLMNKWLTGWKNEEWLDEDWRIYTVYGSSIKGLNLVIPSKPRIWYCTLKKSYRVTHKGRYFNDNLKLFKTKYVKVKSDFLF